MNKLNYAYTRETVRNCKPNASMEVCCSFKSIVGEPCSFDRRDRTRSREIVPLQSCAKNIDQHKSCYGFQDVGNEVELILATVWPCFQHQKTSRR